MSWTSPVDLAGIPVAKLVDAADDRQDDEEMEDVQEGLPEEMVRSVVPAQIGSNCRTDARSRLTRKVRMTTGESRSIGRT
jgi:hypothetical protein